MQKLSAHGTCSDLEKRKFDFIFESDDQKEKNETCIFTVVGSKKKYRDLGFLSLFYLFCLRKSVPLFPENK